MITINFYRLYKTQDFFTKTKIDFYIEAFSEVRQLIKCKNF